MENTKQSQVNPLMVKTLSQATNNSALLQLPQQQQPPNVQNVVHSQQTIMAGPGGASNYIISTQSQLPAITPSKPLQISLKPQIASTGITTQQLMTMPTAMQQSNGNKVITNGGQTFILPSNVSAGSKVFIVNSPGRPPQAIALPANFQMGSGTTQLHTNQASISQQQKQLYVLPNVVQSSAGLVNKPTNPTLNATAQILPNQSQTNVLNSQALSISSQTNLTSTNTINQALNQSLSLAQRNILPKPISASQNVVPKSRLSHYPMNAQNLSQQQQMQDLQKSFASPNATSATSNLTAVSQGLQPITTKQNNIQGTTPSLQTQGMTQQQLLQLIQLAQQQEQQKAANARVTSTASGSQTTRDNAMFTLQQLQQVMRSQTQGNVNALPVTLSSDGKSVILQVPTSNTFSTPHTAASKQLTPSQLQDLQQKLIASKVIDPAHQQRILLDTAVQRNQATCKAATSLVNSRPVNVPITPNHVGSISSKSNTTNATTTSSSPLRHAVSSINKGIPLAQQKTLMAKRIQEQLKQLSPAQREQLIKQQQVLIINGQKVPIANFLQKDKPADPAPVKTTTKAVKRPAPVEPEKKEEVVVETKVSRRLKHCLNADQKRVVEPDYKKPFRSLEDALSRLLPYHVYYEETLPKSTFVEGDISFEAASSQLLDKRDRLRNKYNCLMQDESQRSVSSAEMVMLERIFIASEKAELEEVKKQAEDGTLILPVKHEEKKLLEEKKIISDTKLSLKTTKRTIKDDNNKSKKKPIDINNDEIKIPSIKQHQHDDNIIIDDGSNQEVNEATLNLMADFQNDEFNNEALLALQSLSSSL